MSTAPQELLVATTGTRNISPVPDIARIDKRGAAATNYADTVTRLEGLGLQLARAFTLLDKYNAELVDAGIRTEPILAPHVEAALTAWRLEQAGEAPLPRPVT